jgi:hypothetical protein
MADKPTTKKYAKGERSIPHASQKASKYYPAEDVAAPKKVCATNSSMQEEGAFPETAQDSAAL